MVGTTIYQQLGGRRFSVMTGAKNFVSSENSLRFTIGKNSSKANKICITLNADDTYTMEFWKRGRVFNPLTILQKCYTDGMTEEELNATYQKKIKAAEKAAEPKLLKSYEHIYCDQLQELFTDFTGMYTRL